MNKLFVVALLLTAPCAWAAFPLAGGNLQRTGHVSVPGITEEPAVLWEAPLGVSGECATQPIVDEAGNIYVTAAPSGGKDLPPTDDPRGALMSFEPDGQERWRYEWSWDPAVYRGRTAQLSVPVLGPDDSILMGFRWGWLRCWDRGSGALRWERDLSTHDHPITSAPAVDADGFAYVYIRSIPLLHKIDVRTGDFEWVRRFPDGGGGTASSPSFSVDGKTIYIGRTAFGQGYLYALDTETGDTHWAWSPELSGGHSFAWSVPVVGANGVVYLQDEEAMRLYAVKDLGRMHALQWTYKREGVEAPRLPAFDGTALYSSYNNPTPVVYAVNVDGTERWSKRFEVGTGTGGLVVTSNALYFGLNGTGKVIALSPDTGAVLWAKQVGTDTAGFTEGLSVGESGVVYAGIDATPGHPSEAALVALGARKAKGK
jgi:outer membrane protein assembly factor BamB